jgi:hypothetical protein
MTLEEFEKASDRELRAKANECFTQVEVGGGLDKPHLYQKALFYMSEIERRKQGKANTVGFWLEILVIVLILGELIVGFVEGNKQAEVLTHLQSSFASTAATLTSVQGTMEAMNVSMQAQGGRASDIAVSITYSPINRHLVVTNTGRSDLKMLTYQYDGRRGPHFTPPQPLRKGHSYSEIETDSVKEFPSTSEEFSYLPFRVVLQKPDGENVYAETTLTVVRINDLLRISPGPTIVR